MPPINGRNWAEIMASAAEQLIITEGEFKAACANYHTEYATLGLGGVWNWRAKKHGITMLSQLEEFVWREREVFILFDSDAVTNPDVRAAECALARSLAKRGAHVYIGRLPALDGAKTGLDDFLQKADAAALNTVLEEAVAWGDHEALVQLNTEVAYVENPSLVVRLRTPEGHDAHYEMTPKLFSEEVYKTRSHVVIEETKQGLKEVKKSTAKEWFEWPGRATYHKMTYAPGKPRVLPSGELNSWTAWGIEPTPGNVQPWHDLLSFLFDDDHEARSWFERWVAYPMQNPGAKMRSAAMIWGLQHGTGKSWVGELLCAIYGENAETINDKQLNSQFTTWAYRKQFVALDEVNDENTYAKQRTAFARELNRLITQTTLSINRKYMPEMTTPSVFNLYFNSNDPNSLTLAKNDRRIFVHEVKTQKRIAEPLRAELERWRDSGGLSHLFHYFLSLDLGDMAPSSIPPLTAAKSDMINIGHSMIESWALDAAADPDRMITDGVDRVKWSLVTMDEIVRMIDPDDKHKLAWNVVGPILRRAGFVPVYRSQSLPTKAGALRLWAVRDMMALSGLTGPQLAEVYERERGLQTPAATKARERLRKESTTPPAKAEKVVKFRSVRK
jgi:hypothetical protein